MEQQTLAYPAVEDDDLDLMADNGFRPSRVTLGLVFAIVAVLVFIGGAIVQKHWGSASGTSGTAAGAPSFAGARAGGYGQAAGGFPGGAGGFGGYGQAGGTGAAAGGQQSSQSGTAATPVVVGTVTRLSASQMVVKNLGGKSVTVTMPSGVTISLVKGSKIPTLAKGATVNVAGSTASDGTVTATTVTVR